MSTAEKPGDKHGEQMRNSARIALSKLDSLKAHISQFDTQGDDDLHEGIGTIRTVLEEVIRCSTPRSSMGTFTQREAYVLLRALDFCLNQERDMLDLNPESEWVAVQAKVLALSKNAEPRELPAAAANPLPSASVRTNDDGMREAATSAQQPAGSAPCTCYVLPHEDDCGIFIGITQSGERVMERRSGADRRYFAPSATPRSDGMPLLFNVFNMICQDRDEDWKEQWRELMKEIELVLTRAGYTMPKAGGDYAVAAPIRPTDDGAEKNG